MTEDWKTWAWEMLDKGFHSDALTQLAGEDLNLNPFEFSSLVDSILKDLELDLTDDNVYYHYVLHYHDTLCGLFSDTTSYRI